MEPTIHEGDWIVAVNAPLIREIRCGDVVALGGEWYSGTAAGRVIGLPGDLVQMKSGRLLRNGQYLNEPYRKEPDRGRDGSFSIDLEPVPYGDRWQYESAYGFLVSEDTYFVLSDGRDDVLDSRIAGSVLQAQIIARPVLAYSPLAKPWAWPRLIR
jgi:signal peptidase I